MCLKHWYEGAQDTLEAIYSTQMVNGQKKECQNVLILDVVHDSVSW